MPQMVACNPMAIVHNAVRSRFSRSKENEEIPNFLSKKFPALITLTGKFFVKSLKAPTDKASGGILKLIIYLRVSTEKQEDNTSIPAQEAQLRNWATLNNHEIVGVFTDVESGRSTNRPGLWAALGMLESQQAEGLAAAKLDRLARNVRFSLKMLDEHFVEKEKKLFLLDLPVDFKTALGRAFFSIVAVFAELEVNTIMERTQLGRAFKSLSGGFAFGAPPFGEQAAGGHLIEVPEEQAIVKTIVNLFKKRWTLREIAEYLQASGAKTKRGGKWAAQTVKNILDRLKKGKKQ